MKRIIAISLAVLLMLMMCAWAEEETPCTHENVQTLEIEDWDTIKVISCNDLEHTIQLSIYRVTRCEICGKELSSEPAGERIETSPHQFYNGKCSACGYVNACTHESFTRTEKLAEIVGEPVISEEWHSFKGLFVYTLTCDKCGDIVENGTEERLVEGPHEYDASGKCVCGKIKPEETMIPQPTDTITPEPTATATVTLEPTQEPTQMTSSEPTLTPTQGETQEPTQEPTSDSTQMPTSEPTQEPTQEPSQEPTHEPTQEPTQSPTAEPTQEATATPSAEPTQSITPEPVQPKPTKKPDPTPKPTVQPVVTAAPPELVQRAMELCNGIPLDGHATVLGFDALLTEKEQLAISQLNPAEQLLVLLDVLGCGVLEEENSAPDSVLSEQSLTLMSNLRERMETLNGEEKSALTQMVDLHFPLREINKDDEQYTARMIEMDVESEEEKQVLQHYLFLLVGDDGGWILDLLEGGQ